MATQVASHPINVTKATEQLCSQVLAAPSHNFHCPITHALFIDPVMATDGHTYERQAIQGHFARANGRNVRSPMTNQVLIHTEVISNYAMKNLIQEYKDSTVRMACEIIPLVAEFGDFDKAEALLSRAQEYAGEIDMVRQLHMSILRVQISASGQLCQVDIVVNKLQKLAEMDMNVAAAAISNFSLAFLANLLEALPCDRLATVLVAHEKASREMDRIIAQFHDLDRAQLSSIPPQFCKRLAAILRNTGRELMCTTFNLQTQLPKAEAAAEVVAAGNVSHPSVQNELESIPDEFGLSDHSDYFN